MTLSQQQLRRNHDRAAADFDNQDFFCTEIRARLQERLELVTLEPKLILDLGAGTGQSTRPLQDLFPSAQILEIDWSVRMLKQGGKALRNAICADAHQLPIADQHVDIVFSNLTLPTCAQPERVFAEAKRVLRHPGLLIFTTLGPDTFKELKKASNRIDNNVRVHNFADMHNIGDALVQAGFREPVMDVEILTIKYHDVNKLVADLRAVGATNVAAERMRGLTSPQRWRRFVAELPRDEDGKIIISLEVISGQAWNGPPASGVQMEDGVASFPVSRLRNRG